MDEEMYIKSSRLSIDEEYQEFQIIVLAYPRNYFSITDVSDLEEVVFLTLQMKRLKDLMRLNNPNDDKALSRYNKYHETYNKMLKAKTLLKNALRITNTSRSSPNRSNFSVHNETPLVNSKRQEIIECDPFNDGITMKKNTKKDEEIK